MPERPIIFSAPMVRAILDGRKTMTRRVVFTRVKDSGGNEAQRCERESDGWWFYYDHPSGDTWRNWCMQFEHCPHGQPGDLLWVRETWRLGGMYADGFGADHAPDTKREQLCYRADADDGVDKWRSPIHMPRWASRITLEITDVRVERVQEISESDAKAEGLTQVGDGLYHYWRVGDWNGQDHAGYSRPTAAFRALWSSINGDKTGCSWQENPWVWVIEFGLANR